MGAISQEELAQFRDTAARLSGGWHDRSLNEMIQGCDAAGLMALTASEQWGGLGLDAAALAAVLEPLAGANASAACTVLLQACAQRLLSGAGTDVILPDISDRITLVLEDDFPRHALPEQTKGDIIGTVRNVPLCNDANFLLTALDGAPGSIALVPRTSFREVTPVRTLGLRDWGIGDIDIAGPATLSLESVDREDTRELLTHGVIAISLGLMKSAFATAVEYAGQRRQGGRAITGWGEVRRLLGEMEGAIATIESGLQGLALHQGETGWLALQALRLGADCTSTGVQLLGGNGYMHDFGQERRMRDIRQLQMLVGGMANQHRRLSMKWAEAGH